MLFLQVHGFTIPKGSPIIISLDLLTARDVAARDTVPVRDQAHATGAGATATVTVGQPGSKGGSKGGSGGGAGEAVGGALPLAMDYADLQHAYRPERWVAWGARVGGAVRCACALACTPWGARCACAPAGPRTHCPLPRACAAPRRWLHDSRPRALHVFSHAAHSCLGKDLALMEIKLVVAHLARACRWEVDPPGAPCICFVPFIRLKGGKAARLRLIPDAL